MLLRVRKSDINGTIAVPGSKSHTIRAVFLGSLAKGVSEVIKPLHSEDAHSAINVCRMFGSKIEVQDDKLVIDGSGGFARIPDDVVNVGNSGTTLRIGMMAAGLVDGCSVFTGDAQIRSRPLGSLIRAMNNLGAEVFSTRGNDSAPVVVKGRLKGGKTELDAVTSQYLSSVLITSPLLEKDTEVIVTRLNEVPYVEMTLWWLDKLGIQYENWDFRHFYIKGRQSYKPFKETIPGDFSSATFFMVLAAITGGEILVQNLDITDKQGDKAVIDYLSAMGARVTMENGAVRIKGGNLKGIEIDMNATPDALPAMAVAGCFAEGETRLVNVPQARIKETDRIRVMYEELTKMGADIEELEDGLVIRRSDLKGCRLNGHFDHRIVMALAVAGLNASGETVIDTAEAINVTFPDFVQLVQKCGGDIELL